MTRKQQRKNLCLPSRPPLNLTVMAWSKYLLRSSMFSFLGRSRSRSRGPVPEDEPPEPGPPRRPPPRLPTPRWWLPPRCPPRVCGSLSTMSHALSTALGGAKMGEKIVLPRYNPKGKKHAFFFFFFLLSLASVIRAMYTLPCMYSTHAPTLVIIVSH